MLSGRQELRGARDRPCFGRGSEHVARAFGRGDVLRIPPQDVRGVDAASGSEWQVLRRERRDDSPLQQLRVELQRREALSPRAAARRGGGRVGGVASLFNKHVTYHPVSSSPRCTAPPSTTAARSRRSRAASLAGAASPRWSPRCRSAESPTPASRTRR